jgi:hypothetical protein
MLHMACLAENRRMQQLARKFDAELSFDFGSVVGEVESSDWLTLAATTGASSLWPLAPDHVLMADGRYRS